MEFSERVELIKENPEAVVGLIDLMLGRYIGSGSYRTVYQSLINKNYVVKIQRENYNSNILEYELWCIVKDTPYAKWFAPCFYISDNGKILMQKRTSPITYKNKGLIPDKIPYFFTDLKPENFGFIGNQFVCHDYDYSLLRFVDNGLTSMTRSSKELKLKV